ncbi:MAG TPA: hypothetical protein PLS30_05485 [Flavobacteriales bacterium]|nr:hypothetical protein [Flavobacteriales bacterium]MBK6551626.1 hypothetical protein [Flavobacteriales bacterium]MBK7101630.1 hypothetical protein [Flavobacteriales bacterium]MBK7481660.1 hypothetical protein [Flavobacteriales bacterium]MBK7618642.1 hypothetical protein [Flavobacteriales bacterium]
MRNSMWMAGAVCVGSMSAQNLVRNPSFEDYTTCPNNLNQIYYVSDWGGIGGSPDYYNACANDSMGVPYNALGYQWPSDGDAYAGIGSYPDYNKEWIQGELSAPLTPGVLTNLSLRISPGGFGYPGWTSPYLVASHIGMRFSVDIMSVVTYPEQLTFNTAPLYMREILSDTANWTYLSTTFVPDSAYRYLQIGNFFADSLCAFDTLNTIFDVYAAYAFVDMVCVAQHSGVCDPVQVVEGHVRPSAASAVLLHDQFVLPLDVWGVSGSALGARLYDHAGRVVRSMRLGGGVNGQPWPLHDLPSGLYVIELVVRDRPSLFVRSWKP